MEELIFDGVPLSDLVPRPAMPVGAPTLRPSEPAGDPRSHSGPTPLAERLAEQVQRAHAGFLATHQAIATWQVARAGSLRLPRALAAGPPATARDDGLSAVLHLAAVALRDIDGRPVPGRIALTWHDDAITAPDTLRSQWDGRALTVSDGARPVAGLAVNAPESPPRPTLSYPPDLRPMARTTVSRLERDDLDRLAAGEVAALFGPAFRQPGNPALVAPARWPTRLLDTVTGIDPRGGDHAQGLLHATTRLPLLAESGGSPAEAWPHLVLAATEALRVYALHNGLHLCTPGATTSPATDRPVLIEMLDTPSADVELHLELEVTSIGLVPWPHLSADCRVLANDTLVARLQDVAIVLRERQGTDLTLTENRTIRLGADGRPAFAGEWHTAIFAEGDPSIIGALPTGDQVTASVRPRLPRGDLLMVDRVTQCPDSSWLQYPLGSRTVSEYDAPESAWYLRENNGTVPALALMEIALQPAGLLSAFLGVAGEYPDQDLSCRNLDGAGRLLRPVELAAATIEQHITLRSHSPLPGGILHRYGFELHTGGEAFYTGEAVHGYFTPELLALQQGLDNGGYLPPWLDRQSPLPGEIRRLDLRHDTRLGHGRLALLEDTALVPDGGEHGAGYLLSTKPVRADDWFFDHHFYQDPVMPGSAGVQMLYQGAYAYALYSGLTDHLRDPRCHLAVDEELRWSYRGQILREHSSIRGEVHVREVCRDGDRVRVHADGSIWRDDLRIYRVENIVIDIRDGQGQGTR